MVAPKKAQAAKSANGNEESEVTLVAETVEDSNGAAEATAEETSAEAEAAGGGDATTETTEPAAAPEPETGKLLIENLPSSLLFEYQDKLKEIFSKHGEVLSVKRGPIVITELTTTPTLSAIVEFKNKDSLEQAVSENGLVLSGCRIGVSVQPSTVDTTVLVGVPLEASNEYVRLLFAECGEVAQIQEFSKTKYKILRITFAQKEALDKALKLDRELRVNGFLVTVTKYREDDEQKAFNTSNKSTNKRQHQSTQNRTPTANNAAAAQNTAARNNNFRGRGGGSFNAPHTPYRGRGGGRGGFVGRGSTFVRGGGGGYRGRGAAINNFMGRGAFMGRPGYMMDGQRPNKRLRQE